MRSDSLNDATLTTRPPQSLLPGSITRITVDDVYINHSRDHIASAPRYDPDLAEGRTYFANLYGHYRYTPFWRAGYSYPPDLYFAIDRLRGGF